ncbi:hypothetical protein LR392_09005 [Arthrobacter sp. AK04]|uniref:hypothetical protein n=1 Tax=Arthrobacter sp. AK04 TaxID=2900048 RepID=UPI001E379B85|nr:hypothetical protein [Arthrobacter sp. AK04]MCD5342357.1 hypothetical protein [Arthrobacter sp. AK04]
MRWPWQRKRIEPPTDDAGRGLQQQAAAPPRVPPAGWAFLPPLQRTTTNMQLVSAPDHFTGALAAWGDPSFTSPMAHLVSTAAPAGIIDVDGGGPVRGDGAYPPSSVEMTLLPPPAPGSRPTPFKAGNAGSLQRSASDGVTSAGASSPVGPGLTAAVGTFPILQLDASPLEQTQASSEYTAAPEQAQAQPEQESDDSGALPATDVPAMPAAGDISSAAIAPGASQPIRTVGSTSDGSATYVPLPPPPVQRAQPGTPDIAPALRKVPPSTKLGLGMPLAYSEPAGQPESFAAAALRHVPPPVQRSAAPEPSVPAPATRPVAGFEESHPADGGGPDGRDGDHDHGTGAADTFVTPISGDPVGGTVHLPLLGPQAGPAPLPAVPIQATDAGSGDASNDHGDQGAAGPGDVEPSPVVPDRTLDNAGDDRQDGPADGQENHEPAMHPEPTVAPLLSAGGLDGSLGSPGHSVPDDAPATHAFDAGGISGMPVVSRFGPAVGYIPGPEGAPGEPAVTDAAAEESAGPGSDGAPEHPVDPLAVPPDAGWRGAPQTDDREPVAGQATTSEAPASNAVLPLQRAVEPATGRPLSSTSAALGVATPMINTTPQSNTAPQRPLAFRMARTATADSTPDSVQRLTEMPAAPQRASLSPGSFTAADLGRAAQGSTSAFAPDAPPSLHGYPGPDVMPVPLSGLPGINSPEGPGGPAYEPVPLQLSVAGAVAWPVEAPQVTAAVGRSIQRTLAPEAPASAPGGGPWSAPDSWRPAELIPAAAGPTTQVGGRGPVNLQRSAASSSALAHPVRPDPDGSAFGAGTVPGAAFPEATNVAPTLDNPSGPAVLALALQPVSRTVGDATAQRDAADPAAGSRTGVPAQGAGSVGGPSAAASPSSFDTETSVQADAGSPPAGAGQPVTGAAAIGPAGKQAAGAPAATPEQLEELAKRLTGPLIRRIKAEMLLDRERRGLRTDVN